MDFVYSLYILCIFFVYLNMNFIDYLQYTKNIQKIYKKNTKHR